MTGCNCILAGVGGQGTVLASKLLAQAAMDAGYPVHTAETIGMAQRGGCVVSHVRIGEADAPLIPQRQADVLIGFEPAEAVRNLGFLKPGGRVIVSTRAIVPFTSTLSGQAYDAKTMLAYLSQFPNVLMLDGAALCAQAGSDKVLNTALLGAACALGAFPFGLDALMRTMGAFLPPKILGMNLAALHLGAVQAEEGGLPL